jgi:hypothetical protein
MSNCSCHDQGKKFSKTSVGLLERPRYSPGLILEDSDLTSAVDYTRTLNRLLFRSLFGCGVICGLRTSVEEECGLQVTVAPGLALDGCGDPLHVPAPVTFKLDRQDGVLSPPGTTARPDQTNFWIIACSKEKLCEPRSLVCDGDDFDGARQATRMRSMTEVSISFTPPECVCECEKSDRTFTSKRDEEAYFDNLANRLLPMSTDASPGRSTLPEDTDAPGEPAATATNLPDCHQAHVNEWDCLPDCGCDMACACGCCVLLAWVHWFPGVARGDEQPSTPAWGVLHKGVRRFIRPGLIDDPMPDERPGTAPRSEMASAAQSMTAQQTQTGEPALSVASVERTLREAFAVGPNDKLSQRQIMIRQRRAMETLRTEVGRPVVEAAAPDGDVQ